MTSVPYLTWNNFRDTVLVAGQRRVHRLSEAPRIDVLADGVSKRIGLVIERRNTSAIPAELAKLSEIHVESLTQDGSPFLYIYTDSQNLDREFYHLAMAIADHVLVEKRDALDAASYELARFDALLAGKDLLSAERQIGLLGELLFLEELMMSKGSGAVGAWTGPTGEPHDFRLGDDEFEVKTTTGSKRIHTVNGEEQLVPSLGCRLYITSIVLGPPGEGADFTLRDRVAAITARLRNARESEVFTQGLRSVGYAEHESAHYDRRFSLRRRLALVPVNDSLPALTRPVIQAALGQQAIRIDRISYGLNVEGLEHEKGSDVFQRVMSGAVI